VKAFLPFFTQVLKIRIAEQTLRVAEELCPMNTKVNFSEINESKADFSDLYTSEDPREYFKYLGQLDYIIQHLAQPIFNQLIRARQETQSEPVTVLDIGCSYAINGALMKYAVDYEALRQRYTAPPLQSLTGAEMLDLDCHFYQAWPTVPGVKCIGLDVSENAVRYAENCGILDHGKLRHPRPRVGDRSGKPRPNA
jgi:hypothetical protein